MVAVVSLAFAVAIVAVTFITHRMVVILARMVELAQKRGDEVSREAFENAMDAFTRVQTRIAADQNATLERIVDLVHGPAVEQETGEPEFRPDIENLPPWEVREETEDWTEGGIFEDDPVNVVTEREGAVMVRPGDGMVP